MNFELSNNPFLRTNLLSEFEIVDDSIKSVQIMQSRLARNKSQNLFSKNVQPSIKSLTTAEIEKNKLKMD